MATENTAITNVARAKFASAHKGDITLPIIAEIAFGDGGHDLGGEPIPPTGNETQVPGEFIRKPIESMIMPISTTLRIIGALDFDEGIGKHVSAVGLYDSDGDLVALKTFSPKIKDADTRIEIQWDEKF